MTATDPDLIIYPTSLALRQHQRRYLAVNRFFDSRRHITLRNFIQECIGAARRAGLLRDGDGKPLQMAEDLDELLAVSAAAKTYLADPPKDNPIFNNLSLKTMEDTLVELRAYIAPIIGFEAEFLALLDGSKKARHRALAELYRRYRGVCERLKIADEICVNRAIITLLSGPRANWPTRLRQAQTIEFCNVSWLRPFMEVLSGLLGNHKQRVQVNVSHILQEHEQEWWGGEEVIPCAGSLLFGESAAGSEAADEVWTGYYRDDTLAAVQSLCGRGASLREALAMRDRGLGEEVRDMVAFSVSAGTHGEIEDLARRIVWETSQRDSPRRYADIAVVVPRIGTYAHAIREVFSRYGIPAFFRRGLPLLSVPVIQAALNLMKLSEHPSRDCFCALLESPWLSWREFFADAEGKPLVSAPKVADEIRRAGVEPEIKDVERLRNRLLSYYSGRLGSSLDADAIADRAARVVSAFQAACGSANEAAVSDMLRELLVRCEDIFAIPRRLRHWSYEASNVDEQHAFLLNARAYSLFKQSLEKILSYRVLTDPVRWHDISALLERALANVTANPVPPPENGVWILNPYDTAGLKFKTVMMAGLNVESFPSIAVQNPVFSDADLDAFREQLGPAIPRGALAGSRVRRSRDNLLFMTSLAEVDPVDGSLVLSCIGKDEDGREITPSIFFTTLWRLVGWPAYEQELPPLPLDPYDRYRLEAAGEESHYFRHWHKMVRASSSDRSPFPGESYLPAVPLPLCCTAAEARRTVVIAPPAAAPGRATAAALPVEENICTGLKVEQERQRFFLEAAREPDLDPSEYSKDIDTRFVGTIDPKVWRELKKQIKEIKAMAFSPTALEDLVTCPYAYYLKRLLRLRPVETNELEADRRDFGTAVHEILNLGFRLLRGDTIGGLDGKLVAPLKEKYKKLCELAYAEEVAGKLYFRKGKKKGARRLAWLDPTQRDRYLELFTELGMALLLRTTAVDKLYQLGPPEQAALEHRKIIRAVKAQVALQMEPVDYRVFRPRGQWRHLKPAFAENHIRATALLEHFFKSESDPPKGDADKIAKPQPDQPSLVIRRPGKNREKISVYGKVDRVDLLFDTDNEGELAAIVVIDYKGSGKQGIQPPQLAAEIVNGIDCQLPLYAQTVREYLDQEVPVLLHYLPYTIVHDELSQHQGRYWLDMNADYLRQGMGDEAVAEIIPAEPGDLLTPLREKLFSVLDMLKRGEFYINPVACRDYCDARWQCRYAPGALEPEETKEEKNSG